MPQQAAPKPEEKPVPASEVASPDGRWAAFIRDYNVHLRKVVVPKLAFAGVQIADPREASQQESFPLTFDGTKGNTYQVERFDGENHFPQIIWSPDSRKLVAVRILDADERKIYIVESSPTDQLQPKLRSVVYAKPGDRLPVPRPHLFEVSTRREIPIRTDLFPEPWSIEGYLWSPDSSHFTFLYNERGHQVLRVIAVDAADGTASAEVDEQSKTFVDYAGNHFIQHFHKSNELLWMSERDGWNHLYLFDTKKREVKNQVTKGQWVVSHVTRVDEERRQVWFWARGIVPGQDPYYFQYAACEF